MSKLTLTEPERAELRERESRIEGRIKGFLECGMELVAIRVAKIYREYGTFEEYCRDRWDMKIKYADKLMLSAKVVSELSKTTPMGVVPINERQARPLTALKDKAQQAEAWTEAVKTSNGKPTAKHVEAAVEVVKERHAPIDVGVHRLEKADEKYVLSVGLQYAEMAIASLSNIQRNDTQREAAFAKVSKWLIKNK